MIWSGRDLGRIGKWRGGQKLCKYLTHIQYVQNIFKFQLYKQSF